MELEHSFTVPVPKDRAWDVLLDVERVAPCMPGATLDSVDGDEIRGRIKVKVGPINMTYAGTAKFVERDPVAGVVRLEASGKETRGAGTASATVRSVLEDRGEETHVTVLTTMNVTGKPAQFGRGVMNEVGGRLLTIFAANLAAALAEPDAAAVETVAAEGAGSATTAASAGTPDAAAAAAPALDAVYGEPIDELKLPARVASSLSREGLVTVGQVAGRTADELLAIDGIGRASVEDIKVKLAERGLTLGQAAASNGAVGSGGADATSETTSVASAVKSSASGHAGQHESATKQAAHQLEDDALNLLKVAGMPLLKRALPVLAALAAALMIGLRKRMKRR
jgi:carbon monoxide dehydrogenase subunit G